MAHVFGRSIAFHFVPIANGEKVKVHSIVSARIYADSPSEAQIEDHAAALGGFEGSAITQWVSDSDYLKIITFDALTDADPHSGSEYETYYAVVNFKYESGGPTVFVTEVVHVYRPDALTSRISADYIGVLKVEPKLEDHYTPIEIERFVAEGRDDVLLRYEGMGKETKRLFNLEKLNRAVTYRAAALACVGLYGENARHWLDKYKIRNDQYLEAFNQSRVGYDIAGSDTPAPDEQINVSVAYVDR